MLLKLGFYFGLGHGQGARGNVYCYDGRSTFVPTHASASTIVRHAAMQTAPI